MFYHINHIVLDTATYTQSFAASLADTILAKIKSAEQLLHRWPALIALIILRLLKVAIWVGLFVVPCYHNWDEAIAKHKKGEIFTVWTPAGLHIVKIADDPKKMLGMP